MACPINFHVQLNTSLPFLCYCCPSGSAEFRTAIWAPAKQRNHRTIRGQISNSKCMGQNALLFPPMTCPTIDAGCFNACLCTNSPLMKGFIGFIKLPQLPQWRNVTPCWICCLSIVGCKQPTHFEPMRDWNKSYWSNHRQLSILSHAMPSMINLLCLNHVEFFKYRD